MADEQTAADMPANAKHVRAEDAFDVGAVARWLHATAGIVGTPEVRQFAGGASNLTYLLRYPDRDPGTAPPAGGGEAGVGP